jgi:hypothetical protein
MKRLFTFGCSFTKNNYPTWADILGKEFAYFENWGKQGAGNLYIFSSLNECLIKNKLTSDDLVIIMWSSVCREDRYVENKWLTPGDIFLQDLYDRAFVKKFADPRGYLIRDLALIHATSKMLDSYNIPYIFTSMVPINNKELENENFTESDVLDAYRNTIKLIRPSVFETVFNFDWQSKRHETITNKKDLEKFYNRISGESWPPFQKFYDTYYKEKLTLDDKIFQDVYDF